MSKYDRQLIVDGFRLDSERQRARFLTAKANAAIPPLPTSTALLPRAGVAGYASNRYQLHAGLSPLTGRSRIYLIGHGSWKNQTLGGDTPQTWVTTLVEGGIPAVDLISITGCQAGRDAGSSDDMRVTEGANSFASQFHQLLGDAGIKVKVYARAYKVRIRSGGAQGSVGQKFTEGVHHRERSKILFYWEGGQQRRKWVDYGATDDPNTWLDVDDWAEQAGFIAALMAL